MATNSHPKALEPPSGGGDLSAGGASAQPHLLKPAHDGFRRLKAYLLAVKTFRGGQSYSAKPSAYETENDDGEVGPAITVLFIRVQKTEN